MEGIFLIANVEGAGDLPSPDEATWIVLNIRAANIMEEFRTMRRLLEEPPADLVEALHAWDPERQAVVLGTPLEPPRPAR